MSTPDRRRNRSLASCEPCRKGKIRCDHQKPICGSCRRRQAQSECWYHPAPLTKQTPRVIRASGVSRRQRKAFPQGSGEPSDVSINIPTSLASYSTADESIPGSSGTSRPMSNEPTAHGEQISTLIHIVSWLENLPLIERLLNRYFASIHNPLLAKPVALQTVASLREFLAASGYIQEETEQQIVIRDIQQLAAHVFHTSLSEIRLAPSMSLRDFCAEFSGENLRVETLGFLYTVAARASIYDTQAMPESKNFMQEMSWYSNASLHLAREIAPQTSDMIIWLALDNLQLITMLEGDASMSVRRRIGGLATDIFALGLNREATYSSESIPFFLAECRRKTFSAAYYLDKLIAIFFNQPPCISIRHSDCKAPLDLSDEQIFSLSFDDPAMESIVDHDGWNRNGGFRSTTWARVRYIFAQFREHVVEYQLSSSSANEAELRDLSQRCHHAWNSLPQHLQYSKDCWSSVLPAHVSLMLCKVYLPFLHTNFLICQKLGNGAPSSQPELLAIALEMLEVVVQVASARSRPSLLMRDLPGLMLTYGVSCATTLLSALMDSVQKSTGNLPPGIKASTLIRNLSVFISHLENLSGSQQCNQALCEEAAKSLSSQLDRVLDSLSSASEDLALTTPLSMGFAASEYSHISHVDAEEPSSFQIGNAESFDWATWIIHADLEIVGCD
ncbi:hypothetical protein N7452_003368 [Penicillium brevicompactum]|uniref:Zn(2)-C6 fungal-type domain-containing protein n=1 Tax=Penicillium brevicompactum TaxID=5074 RepID=A0A9W9QTS1_PENBR|nr:hypothetical protein N7452_003368 [Penicillium brevicompactum]